MRLKIDTLTVIHTGSPLKLERRAASDFTEIVLERHTFSNNMVTVTRQLLKRRH